MIIGHSGRSLPWQPFARSSNASRIALSASAFPAEVRGARFRQRLDFRARAIAIRPETKQLSDFFDRKTEIAGIGDETQPMYVSVRIVSIATVTPRRRRNETDLLVVADHPLRDAAPR